MPSFLLRAHKMIQLGEGDVFDVFDFVRVWLNGEVWVANFVKENVVEFVFTPLVPPIGFGSIEDSGTAGHVCGHFTILIVLPIWMIGPIHSKSSYKCVPHQNQKLLHSFKSKVLVSHVLHQFSDIIC